MITKLRLLLATLVLLVTGGLASAQTVVGGTVTDTDSQTWNNGSITFSSLGLGVSPVSAALSAAGVYSGVSIPHSSATGLVGDVWTVTVCPSFSNYPCFKTSAVISGATQTLNVTPGGIRVNAAIPYQLQPAAYLDSEITNGYLGFEYFNAVSNVFRMCSSISGGACVWTQTQTSANCAVNGASPAACGAATTGAVVVPTTTTTYTVNTTAVTANSRIQVFPITDNTGLPSAPTCTAPPTPFIGYQSARVAGTSFTFTLPSTAGTSCWVFEIVN